LKVNLDRYNLFFKKDIIDIYHSWININKPLYIKYYNLIGLMIMSMLIPLDYILYENNYIFFTQFRIIYISIILLNLLYIQINQKRLFEKKKIYRLNINLLLPALLYNIIYISYLYNISDNYYTLVLLANFITIIVTIMFAAKFWKEQYAISTISLVIIFFSSIYKGKYIDGFYLTVFHLISFVSAYFFRRSFILSMYERYYHTASLVPKNVAKHIAMTDGVIELDKIFKPTKRFTVCLSSDWRNYQELASTKDPKYIEELFQNFYNYVFEELDRVMPEGNYYADWTADELFIIFFDEENNENNIIKNALTFSHVYAEKIFNKINANIDSKLMYDIGMASGVGLLGLQGPEKLKKTTITGESAGTAKRLETEAKNLRNDVNAALPILIVDERLYECTQDLNLFNQGFREIIAITKDIKNKNFYLWLNNDFKKNDKQLEIEL